MPIINDRDNNKTIDADTGVYVELVSDRPNEQLSMFNIIDGGYNIYLETERKTEDVSGVYRKIYFVRIINSNKDCLDLKYKQIIRNLLVAFQEYHGRISGVPMVFDVDFSFVDHLFASSSEVGR